MKQILACLVALCVSTQVWSQSAGNSYFHEMDADAKVTTPSAKEKTESAYYVLNEVLYEYVYPPKGEGINLYYSHHVRVHLVDDKGVESFNTIDLPAFSESSYSIKARTILPDGTVKNLDKKNIREKVDEETGQKRKIFALEGLTPGAEIEYILAMQLGPQLQQRDYFQNAIPIRKAKFELISPKNLVFDTKGYNGFRKVQVDTPSGRVRRIVAEELDVPSLPDERYSNRQTYMPRIDYKFGRNTDNAAGSAQTWEDYGRKINANYTATAEDLKRLKNYLEDDKEYSKLTTDEEKIMWIENHLKTRLTVSKDVRGEDAEDVKYVLKNKVTSEGGMCLMHTYMYQAAGINHEIIYTSDRSKVLFDKDFVSSLNLSEVLIYFPDQDKYIKPDWVFYRYPLLPSDFQGTDALRCAKTEVGGVVMAVGEIHRMPIQEPITNNHIIYADVSFNLEEGLANAKMKHEMFGVMASGYRPVFLLADKDQQKQVIKDLINVGSQNDKIENSSTANTSFADANKNNPLVISADVESSELLEKAGPDYIVHIGKVIGTQVEMYQDKERVTDINIDFLHHLKRYITVKIPKGYKVKNLNNLVIDIKQGPSGKRYGFLSSYTLEGDVLKIVADEWYCEILTPKSEFEQFRAVINAAADFEKATILLEKE
jgi:hypothetical protein